LITTQPGGAEVAAASWLGLRFAPPVGAAADGASSGKAKKADVINVRMRIIGVSFRRSVRGPHARELGAQTRTAASAKLSAG